MRGLARLLTVLGMGAAAAILVIFLEKRYLPDMLEPQPTHIEAADVAEETPASDIDVDSWSPVAPLRNEVATGLAARLYWNDAAKPFLPGSEGGWQTTLRAVASKDAVTKPPEKASSQANSSARPVDAVPNTPLSSSEPPPAAVRPASLVDDSRRDSIAPAPGKLRGDESMELMRQLRAEDKETMSRARGELIRRGFTEVDLELARRLFDPDVEVRKRLARSLPGLTSIDAASWLLALCRDPDSDVRMTAVTLMATTGDPGLLERVEAMAREDADSRIRDLADSIASQRTIAGSRGGPASANRLNASRGSVFR